MVLGAIGQEAHSQSGCEELGLFAAPAKGPFHSRREKIRGGPPAGGDQLAESNVVAHLLWQVRPGLLPNTHVHVHMHTQLYSCRAARSPPYRGVDVAIISLDPSGETRRHLLDEQHHIA